MTSEQEKAREQISIMQQEWKREQVLVQELEKEKEEHRQDLEDLMENNRQLESVNTALRQGIEQAKNQKG